MLEESNGPGESETENGKDQRWMYTENTDMRHVIKAVGGENFGRKTRQQEEMRERKPRQRDIHGGKG